MNNIRRLIPYLAPHKRRFIQACFVMFGVAILNGASVWVLKPAVDYVFVSKDMKVLY